MKYLRKYNELINYSEGIFSFKPLGDVEQARKDSLVSMRKFLQRYSGIVDIDSLTDQQVLKKIKGFAYWAKSPNSSIANKMAYDLYRIAKPLFESFSMRRENCDRCKGPTNNTTIQSQFNHQVICMKCKKEEKLDPDYKLAVEAEQEAIRNGDYNYPGFYPNYTPIK